MSAHRDKPPAALAQFALELGWPELKVFQHTIDKADVAPHPIVVTWYESGVSNHDRRDLFLQINEVPPGPKLNYACAVYAMRYRICSGWHPFELHEDEKKLKADALSIEGWLHRRWFETPSMRREYRRLHPECSRYSWSRIQKEGPPSTRPGR